MVYKKRYNTKKNKTKRFNKYAYAKTDSRNQAKQIVQLNKKISNVYKTLRPELNKITSSGEFNISSSMSVNLPLYKFFGLDGPDKVREFIKGNYSKFIYFNFKFFFNSGSVDLTQGKTLRVVIFQNRNGRDSLPSEAELFQDHTQSIISSFKTGTNENFKILLDKKYIISSDADFLYKSYNFKKLIGYNKLTKGLTSFYDRGTIFVLFITTQTTEFKISWNSSIGHIDS